MTAYEYLVREGVGEDRLEVVWVGESRPVNDCLDGVDCPEDEHQENRRTEIQYAGEVPMEDLNSDEEAVELKLPAPEDGTEEVEVIGAELEEEQSESGEDAESEESESEDDMEEDGRRTLGEAIEDAIEEIEEGVEEVVDEVKEEVNGEEEAVEEEASEAASEEEAGDEEQGGAEDGDDSENCSFEI